MLDVFNRSYLQNMRLIVGFVEGDKKIVAEVNGKAVGTAVFIVVVLRDNLLSCVVGCEGGRMGR